MNSVSLKSCRSQILSLPRPLDNVTYALKGESMPVGGVAKSAIRREIVWLCALMSVNEYPPINANCCL